MEIFNIHLLELLLIGGLALIVFGPERLPEVGRFLGQQVARFLAWQQQSPELQMLNEVRGEFEREIASLRDELVRTRTQLDMSRDLSAIKDELRPMLDLKSGMTQPANGVPPAGAPEASIAPPELASEPTAFVDAAGETLFDLAETVAEPELTPRPAAQTVPAASRPDRLGLTEPSDVFAPKVASSEPDASADTRAAYLAERRRSLHDAPPLDDVPAVPELSDPPSTAPADEELLRRVGELSAALHALVGELQERGVLGSDWRAPAAAAQETIAQ